MEVKLGQLFLLRRDLKAEINSLSSEVASLIAYREDKDSTVDEYLEVNASLVYGRKKLSLYDMLIEKENSAPGAFHFDGEDLSLNNARHLKVHLLAELGHAEMLVRQAASNSKRVDRENVYELSDPTNLNSQRVPVTVEKKYVVVPDLKILKDHVKQLKDKIQLLDSQIQQADWDITVIIP